VPTENIHPHLLAALVDGLVLPTAEPEVETELPLPSGVVVSDKARQNPRRRISNRSRARRAGDMVESHARSSLGKRQRSGRTAAATLIGIPPRNRASLSNAGPQSRSARVRTPRDSDISGSLHPPGTNDMNPHGTTSEAGLRSAPSEPLWPGQQPSHIGRAGHGALGPPISAIVPSPAMTVGLPSQSFLYSHPQMSTQPRNAISRLPDAPTPDMTSSAEDNNSGKTADQEQRIAYERMMTSLDTPTCAGRTRAMVAAQMPPPSAVDNGRFGAQSPAHIAYHRMVIMMSGRLPNSTIPAQMPRSFVPSNGSLIQESQQRSAYRHMLFFRQRPPTMDGRYPTANAYMPTAGKVGDGVMGEQVSVPQGPSSTVRPASHRIPTPVHGQISDPISAMGPINQEMDGMGFPSTKARNTASLDITPRPETS
jgi:hypothetical protein